MDTTKQPVKKVLPEDKKELIDDMPDHLKSPLHGIKDKRQVGNGEEE